MYDFHVHGIPQAQGSKKHVGNGRMVEAAKGLPAWRRAVTSAAKQAKGHNPPLDGPLAVTARFFMPKPRTTKFGDYPAGPSDLDKLQRAIGDALTQAGIIADDARIVTWHATKTWATNQPGAHITITPQENP